MKSPANLIVFVSFASLLSAQSNLSTQIWGQMEKAGVSGQKHVAARHPLEAGKSIVVATSDSNGLAVFVVRDRGTLVDWAVEILPKGPDSCNPRLETGPGHRAYVHCFNDYGLYQTTIRYKLDIAAKIVKERVEYQPSGPLVLRQGQWRPHQVLEPETLTLKDGTSIWIDNPDAKGLHVAKKGQGKLYPIPAVTVAEHRRLRPKAPRPWQVENKVGPMVADGARVWVAGRFYNGEGMSGVGGLYEFDASTGKYKLHRIREMIDWSGSAMALDGRRLWIGLVKHPEGYPMPGGLLRYDIETGECRKYPMKDAVWEIEKHGNVIRLATDYGAVELDESSGKMTQFRVEPGVGGKPEVVKVAYLPAGERAGEPPAARR